MLKPDMSAHARVNAGVPTGGQFSAQARGEADVDLDADALEANAADEGPRCAECGSSVALGSGGVSHHLDEDGRIDFGADADHVALDDRDYGSPVEVRTENATQPRLKRGETRHTSQPAGHMTADQHRLAAKEALQAEQDSWERSDTDGFLSQHAHQLTALMHTEQAKIEDNGGMAEFTALADADGNPVPAKLVSTRFGMAWGLLSDPGDPHSAFTGFVNVSKASTPEKRAAALAKKGYRTVTVKAPAKAKILATGTGMSGLASAHVGIVRTDGGFSKDAQVVPDKPGRDGNAGVGGDGE